MKKMRLWLAVVPLALGLVACGQSGAGTGNKASTSKASASSRSAAKSSSIVKVKESKPKYAKDFKAVTIPKKMQGKWYGYAANANNLTIMDFARNAVTLTGLDNDGQTKLTYDPEVRTKEDQEALSASNGGSVGGPTLTAGDKYRQANWVAAKQTTMNGQTGLNLWNNWYIADAGTFYTLAQRKIGKKLHTVLLDPMNHAIFYRDKSRFLDDEGHDASGVAAVIPTDDDFFVLAFLKQSGFSLRYAYESIVEEPSWNFVLVDHGSKIYSPGSKPTDQIYVMPFFLKGVTADAVTYQIDNSKNPDKKYRHSEPFTETMSSLEEKMITGDSNEDDMVMLQAIRVKMEENGAKVE